MYRGFGALALIHSSTSLSPVYLTQSLSVFQAARSDSHRQGLARRSRVYQRIAMASNGKRKASEGSSASGGAMPETPDWFKPDRVRCLTDVSKPRDKGEALRAVCCTEVIHGVVVMRTLGRTAGSLHQALVLSWPEMTSDWRMKGNRSLINLS